MPSESTVVLDLRIRVNPDRRNALIAFLRRAVAFYEQPGGIRIRLLQSDAKPALMIERVEYANATIFEQDQRRVAEDPEMNRYLQEWRSLLEGPPEVEVYREVALSGSISSQD